MTVTRRKRNKRRHALSFTATCAAGLEELVRAELERFGAGEITITPGAVSWQGSLESGYRACLWSRFASRILLVLERFPAPDPDQLYRRCLEMDWGAHFDHHTSFAVFCTTSGRAAISHSRFAALRVKDGIADHFRNRTGKRPNVDPRSPQIRINLHLHDDQATVALDLSGDGLHRRGYRLDPGPAPLKETLAAAIAALSGVEQGFAADEAIIDPMCGSGTLLIEAALMLSDSAPGLQRRRFGFTAWLQHNHALWERLVQEALKREQAGQDRQWPRLIGTDCDPEAVRAARANVARAGLDDRIRIELLPLARLRPPTDHGLLITNPPYGERLSEKTTVKYLLRCFDRIFGLYFNGWRLGFFSAHPDLAELVSCQRRGRFRLHNGPIVCRLLTGVHQDAPHRRATPLRVARVSVQEGPGQELANRIRKNMQRLSPWIKRKQIEYFRVYDADIPSFNLAVDVVGRMLHVQEYAPPANMDPDRARKRFSLALRIIREVFGCDRSRVFIKTRQRQRGRDQYQKKKRGEKKEHDLPRMIEVREGGLLFLVNLSEYLDTGLFIDHRKTRDMVRRAARDRAFLNLFGYTGSATVYAAAGGARSTTTVDTSRRYLHWARANLALNGYGGPLHQTIQEDCLDWLENNRQPFDLIFCDPPTFSNARHRGRTFSVQKDHPRLLRLAMSALAPDGTMIFSTNYRKFKMDPALTREFPVREITHQTLPPDFRQKHSIHRSFILTHPAGSSAV